MGVFEDYINGLEGKDNLDPLEVVKELTGLHSSEIGTREAKIQTLESKEADYQRKLAEKEQEIIRQKAINYDLDMGKPAPTPFMGGMEIDPSEVTIDSLFKPKKG